MTSALWYLGRGTGVTALVLLTLVLVLGIVVRSGRSLPETPRFVLAAIHRTTSLSAVGFLTVHIGTLLFDPYAQLRLVDTVLPFAGRHRPLWLGLGTTAFDLMAFLVVSSLLRHRLGLRTWRAIHWLAYACWPFAVGHALGTGTDAGSRWLLAVVLSCCAAVLAAGIWRLSGRDFRPATAAPARIPALEGRR